MVSPVGIPALVLRKASELDFDPYFDAFERVAEEGRWLGGQAPVDREARRAHFERCVAGDTAVLFIAEIEGDLVGGASATLAGGTADLLMFVAAGKRGNGIGGTLLEAAIDWSRAVGAHKMALAVWPTNHPARGLYAKYGFRVEGRRRRHHQRRSGELWDSILMGLSLDEHTAGGPGPRGNATIRSALVPPAGGLGDGSVVLRTWSPGDIPALMAAVDDDEIRRWLDTIPSPYTVDDAEEYVAGARQDLTEGRAATFALTADGHLAGAVALRLDPADPGVAELGYWVGAHARGRGIASTAARLISDWAFSELGVRRIEVNAAVANRASGRTAERAGFELEGIRRAWRTVHGEPHDFALYARAEIPRPTGPAERTG